MTLYEANITVRVTSVYDTFKKNDPSVYFRAVQVDKQTHAKSSAIDYYLIKAPNSILPNVGEIWNVQGGASWKEAPSHDGNYVIRNHNINENVSAELVLSDNPIGFKSFIASTSHFKGVGPKLADALWSAFGTRTYELMERGDVDSLMSVKGLNRISAESLINGYKKFAYLKYSEFFTKYEIPVYVQRRIYNFNGLSVGSVINKGGVEFSRDPKVLIESNPYHLNIFGMSFHDVDKLARKHFNIAEDDSRRLIAAVTEALRNRASKGHTVSLQKDLKKPLRKLLCDDNQLITLALSGGYDKRAFIIYPNTGVYQFTPTYIMENVVAKRILKLNQLGEQFDNEESNASRFAIENAQHELEGQQKEAVLTSVSHSVSCITGGAGTGKTTVLNTVLSAYEHMSYDIKAVALSGRAAMRMRQSIKRPSSTIAKFLRQEPLDNAEQKQLLVIDESSMVDLASMYRIVLHTAPSVSLLFVGDPNQLPSIGAGNILSDIIDSNIIANTELDIVKRQGATSKIPEYTKNIREGIVPEELTTGAITFHNVEYDEVAEFCIGLLKESPESSRVVAPTNTLVNEINSLAQAALNSESKPLRYEFEGEFFTELYRLNDPILFTKNNYDAGVQNGSLGNLVSVEQEGNHYGVVKMDDFEDPEDEFVPITQNLLLNIQLGYAITVHKAQGSQFPRVIVALSPNSMLDRAWLYTAITRAECEVHIVGPKSKLISTIKNQSNANKRQTHLKTLLTEGFNS